MTEREMKVRRGMALVYVVGIALWVVVGVKGAMPWWLVGLAIAFCCVRVWMALRVKPRTSSFVE